MKIKFRFMGLVAAFAIAASFSADLPAAMQVYAEETSDVVVIAPNTEITENTEDDSEVFIETKAEPMFSFPTEMRGVYITPTVDYAAGENEAPEEISAETEEILDKIEADTLNAVIINTDFDGRIFYSTDLNESDSVAPVEYIIEAAKDRGMFVYLTFNIDSILAKMNGKTLQERIDALALNVHTFTVKYPVDGIILEGYYSSKSNSALADYISDGAGIGFENWLMDNGAYVFSLASDAVRKTNNTVPVGISITDVWANYTTNDGGSETSVDFEALTDGYADTLGYIKKGYADFVMLRIAGSRSDSAQPFEEISSWWDSCAESAGIPLFLDHMNEKICTEAEGWGSPDELVKQVVAAKENLKAYAGSAFNSLSALNDNMMDSTTVLVKHYEDEIDLEGLNSELEMTLPTKTNYKTEEPSVIFAGSFDPNFPVYYQGKEIQLNEAGRFYFTEDLDVGVNTFKFQSKAKVITYRITRTVNVLKSVAPADSTMKIEEQSSITLSAIAYKGAAVSAEMNGKTVRLKEVDGQSDDIDPNSSYAKFVGKYVAPAGKIGEEIDLGRVTFYGTYSTKTGDISESRQGAHVIINALPQPVAVPSAPVELGSGEGFVGAYTGDLIMVSSDNTMVYNSKTTDTAPTPDMARLPAGTLDYVASSVSYGGSDYYITQSGKRIRQNAVSSAAGQSIGENVISLKGIYKDGTDTMLKIGLNDKIPFSISYNGQSFTEGDNGSFYVSSFNASGITITFDYISSVTSGKVTFPSSAVFDSASWQMISSDGVSRAALNLNFRQRGIYSGVSAAYDSEGNLIFRFNGCRNSLSGATIVIDPGHGYTGAANFDPGAVGHIKEQVANLAIAKYLEKLLTDEGANVIRFHTESETYVTEQRASIARQYNPDMFIAVHCNSAGESATGAEAYYFTPFSYSLAKYVSAAMGGYLYDSVDFGGNGDRGAKYNFFYVTQQQEFPSILVEAGFVTNYTEAMALADPTHQKNIAKAMVSGIKKYFAECGYSCFGSDGGTVDNTAAEETLPEETEPIPEETTAALPVEQPTQAEDIPQDTTTDDNEEHINVIDPNNYF